MRERIHPAEAHRRARQPNWGAGRRYSELVGQGMSKRRASEMAMEESRTVVACDCGAEARLFEARFDGWVLSGDTALCAGCLDEQANERMGLA